MMQKLTGWLKIKYVLILSGFRLLTLFPLSFLFLISELITFIVYFIIKYRRKVVLANLKNSFPDYNAEEIQRVSRKYYRHLSVMIVENIYLRFIPRKRIAKRLLIENKDLLDKLRKQNKNIILMLGHFGNWEFAAGLPNLIGYKGAAVYKKLSSKVFDKIYYEIRSGLGVLPIEMKESVRAVYEMNQQNDPFALIMVSDQAPPGRESNHWIQFLNQQTAIFEGSEKLAVKFDMAVVYVEVLRKRKGVYRIIPTLISDKPKETDKYYISEKFFELLEASIKRSPRYWLWSHKRWKNKRTQPETSK